MNQKDLQKKIQARFKSIYGKDKSLNPLILNIVARTQKVKNSISKVKDGKWSEKDIILITYADSIVRENESPLVTLHKFLNNELGKAINNVHILPFFPFSSDDGFSVIDYQKVNPVLGDWDDIQKISQDYTLMADLVINHISQESEWFQNYLKGSRPGKGYFIEVSPKADLSDVVRPRSLPLLTAFETSQGTKHVWTTFSADQIDLNFANPEVLVEILNIFLFYIARGARIIRLDAIAFLWKEIGTSCLHLKQTHEVVKLMRDLIDYLDTNIILITETNVPNQENLSYLGNGDEAHMVYQFSLPPLLLHALHTANSEYLTKWALTLSDIPKDCTFFNFTASHDGIGVRPLEGLLPKAELTRLADNMKELGGYISTKRNSDGTDSPYEINITYLDALKHCIHGADGFQVERFICSQTIMMSFQGIPSFYIHSLLGTHNYNEGVSETGMPRTINRKKWDAGILLSQLHENTEHKTILNELIRRIQIRKNIPAFHPDRKQEVVQFRKELFVLKRGDDSDLLVVANLSNETVSIISAQLAIDPEKSRDLLSDNGVGKSLILKPYQVVWIASRHITSL